jgi:hypothetical protein
MWKHPAPDEMLIEAAAIEGQVCFGHVKLLQDSAA